MQENETPPVTDEKPANKQKYNVRITLIRLLVIAGVVSIGAGLLNLIAALSPSLAQETSLMDGLFNISMGVLLYLCSRFLKKGKSLVIWLFGAAILFNLGFNYSTGRGINYLIAVVGVFVLWQLFELKKNKELA